MGARVGSLHQDNQFGEIKKWLLPPDPSTNFNEAKGKRHPGTGSWFLESDQFTKWKSGARHCHCLWLHGILGCGKSVLSSTVIEHLRQHQDASQIVLYFFFDFTDSNKQVTDKLIRSLLSQLYSGCEKSRDELDELFKSHKKGLEQPETARLSQTFQHIIRHVEKIQIVIDALDECRDRKELLPWMDKLLKSGHTGLFLLFTSRKEGDIESGLKLWLKEEHIVSIQQDLVDSDIRLYVQEKLYSNKELYPDNEFHRWDNQPSVLEEIETEIMKKAGGM